MVQKSNNILLLGKSGMLGRAIRQKFEIPVRHASQCEAGRRNSKFEFTSFGHEDFDITNKKSVHGKIAALKPSIVINATGYTNVDGAETDRKAAYAVNAEGVGYTAEICAKIGAIFFHFSTDYIFDGSQSQGYKEDEVGHIRPLNVYGASKLEGERLIQKLDIKNQNERLKIKNFRYYIIRTSWLYGAGGKNFVDTMLSLAKSGKAELKVVNDQFGLPTHTVDLARQLLWMIEHESELESGVYHYTNSSTASTAGISWFEFAQEIFKQARERGMLAVAPIVSPCTTEEFPRPARRPRYSALLNTKLPNIPNWRDALLEYLKNQNNLLQHNLA